MSCDKNEFYLNLSKEIMDINYDVFNNFIPTNYQDNYINYIEKYEDKDNYEKDITNNFYNFIKSDFNPNRSQKFVNNFLYNTPNRGLLLYHGLGVGKTCAAIIPSQMYFFNKIPLLRKHTIIICPASLESEWIQEIQTKCGCKSDNINLKDPHYLYRYYTFIRLTGSSGTGFRKVNYSIETNPTISEKCIDHPNKVYLGDKVQFFYASKMFSGIIIDILDGTFNKNTYNPTKFKVYFSHNKDKNLDITINEIEYEFDKIITINRLLSDNQSKQPISIDNKITEIYCKIDKINRKYSNAFDNKFVIIDEAHNFTSFLNKHYSPNIKLQADYNPDKKAKCISYEKLCSAINCKILLLTGTPIEHDIAEIPYLINILHGYIQLFLISFDLKNTSISKNQQLDIKLKNKLLSLNYINYFDINRKGSTIIIKFTTIPPSYIHNDSNDLTDITFSYFFKKNKEEIFKLEQDYDESKQFVFNNNNIIKYTQYEIDNLLKTMDISTTNIWLKSVIFDESKKNSILPVNYKEMNNQKILNFDIPFLVKDDRNHPIAIKNKEYLTNSFQGKISYDAGVGSEQGIKKIDCKINLYFESSTVQFQSYKESRDKEKKDKNPLRTQSQNDCLFVLKEEDISDKTKDDILKEYIDKINEESKNYNIKYPNKTQKTIITLNDIDKNKYNNIIQDYYLRGFILKLYEQTNNVEKLEFLNNYTLKYENLIRILQNNYDIIQTYIKDTNSYNLSDIEDYTFNSITYPTGKVLIYSSFRKKGITAICHILETFGYKSLNEIILEHYNNFKTFFIKKC